MRRQELFEGDSEGFSGHIGVKNEGLGEKQVLGADDGSLVAVLEPVDNESASESSSRHGADLIKHETVEVSRTGFTYVEPAESRNAPGIRDHDETAIGGLDFGLVSAEVGQHVLDRLKLLEKRAFERIEAVKLILSYGAGCVASEVFMVAKIGGIAAQTREHVHQRIRNLLRKSEGSRRGLDRSLRVHS